MPGAIGEALLTTPAPVPRGSALFPRDSVPLPVVDLGPTALQQSPVYQLAHEPREPREPGPPYRRQVPCLPQRPLSAREGADRVAQSRRAPAGRDELCASRRGGRLSLYSLTAPARKLSICAVPAPGGISRSGGRCREPLDRRPRAARHIGGWTEPTKPAHTDQCAGAVTVDRRTRAASPSVIAHGRASG